MLSNSTQPTDLPSVESTALDLLLNAETFLHNSKGMLQDCPGYTTLKSQLDLWVPAFRSHVNQAAVDGFRAQRTIDLLRSLHTFLLDDTTRRNIDTAQVGIREWALLVLPITAVIALLKGRLHQSPLVQTATVTRR